MSESLEHFEQVVRRAGGITDAPTRREVWAHPFDDRNIHERLPPVVRDLFDDGYFSQATFEASKFLDKEVQRVSGLTISGSKLMLTVFREEAPYVMLTPLRTLSDKDEQKGFQFLFAGSVLAIRNPRGHEVSLADSPDECLDHLALVSLLLRRLYGAHGDVRDTADQRSNEVPLDP